MRSIRANFLFIVAYVMTTVFYLNEIEVIKPAYISKNPPDYLKATLTFILWNLFITLLYYLNKNRQVIIDKAYEWYERNEFYEEEALVDPEKFNQQAVNYIENVPDSFLAPQLKPLEYFGDSMFETLLIRDHIVVKYSRLYHFIMGILMLSIPIYLATQIDYSRIEGIFYVYLFGLISIIISSHNFYTFFRNASLFTFNNNGLQVDDRIYKWRQIEFGFLKRQNKFEYLSIKLVGVDEPITFYHALGELNISRKPIGHCFEYFHRKYSNEKTGT